MRRRWHWRSYGESRHASATANFLGSASLGGPFERLLPRLSGSDGQTPGRDLLENAPARPAEDVTLEMAFTLKPRLERRAMQPSQCA